jgi:citrate lyase subunit beta/citryl-CoA lyase
MNPLTKPTCPLNGRSFLFVPGDRPERFTKAIASGADCVIIDLEDSVDPERKVIARNAARSFMESGARVLLRLNGAGTPWFIDDLALCTSSGVLGVVVPKVESAADLGRLQQRLSPETVVLPLVETAKGVVNVDAIAEALGRGRLVFGSVDLCLDLGIQTDDDEHELAWYRTAVILASRASRLPAPVDGVFLNLHDNSGLARSSKAARRMGFGGKLCLHPSQIENVHIAFSASSAEVDWAQQVLRAAQSAHGAFRFEGRMIDAPVLERARRLVSRD